MINMSYKTKEEKLNPLLDSKLEEELKNLKEEYSNFSTCAEEIKNELDITHLEDKISISNFTFKLQKLKSNMEIINNKIKLLRNFCKDDDDATNINSTLILLKNIKTISSEVSRKYDVVNKKFNEKIENMHKLIQSEISQNNLSEGEFIDTKLHLTYHKDPKLKINIDRLKERQSDLEKITFITSQLLMLSKDIRQEAEKQGKVIMSIEDHITDSNVKTAEANEQLNKRRHTQTFNSKFYCWIATGLFLVIVVALSILYWKIQNKDNEDEILANGINSNGVNIVPSNLK